MFNVPFSGRIHVSIIEGTNRFLDILDCIMEVYINCITHQTHALTEIYNIHVKAKANYTYICSKLMHILRYACVWPDPMHTPKYTFLPIAHPPIEIKCTVPFKFLSTYLDIRHTLYS